MTNTSQAILFTQPGEIQLGTVDLPPCGPGDVIVESIYTTVSPGTELRVLAGTKEAARHFPLIPGYCVIGKVVEMGSDVRGWRVGDLTTGKGGGKLPGYEAFWGGQVSHHRCQPDQLIKLPSGADPWDYVLAELGAIAWRGATICMPAPDETAVVIGQGMIGALAARWLLMLGVRVIVTDLEPARLDRALRWGAFAAVDGRDADAKEQIQALCAGGADIVVEASASIPGATMARQLLRPQIIHPWVDNYRPDQIRGAASIFPRLLYMATYTKTIEIIPSGAEGVEGALVLTPIDRTLQDRQAAVQHIARGKLHTADFVEAPTPVSQAPGAYRRLRDHPEDQMTVVFSWGP